MTFQNPSSCLRHPGVPAGSEPCERCGQFLCLVCLLEGDITGRCGPCYEPLPKLLDPIILRKEIKEAARYSIGLNSMIVLLGIIPVQIFLGTSTKNAFLFISLICVSVTLALAIPYFILLLVLARTGNPARRKALADREASRARHLRGALAVVLSLRAEALEDIPGSQEPENQLDSILADLISGKFQKSPRETDEAQRYSSTTFTKPK